MADAENLWAANGGVYLGLACDNTEGPPRNLQKRPIFYVGDRHIVSFGPNGSGKSRRLLGPNLMGLVDWSILVIDPKGELARESAEHRADAGGNVILLNPFDVLRLGSTPFNPVAALDPASDDFIDDALGLAEALIRVEGSEPHWSESAQDLLCALIMYSRLTVEGGGSLRHVRSILGLASDEFRREVGLMREAAVIHDCEELAVKASRFMAIDPENKELNSILSTAMTQTRWLDSRPIKNALDSGADIFSAMKEEPTTVYLILPANRLGTHSGWLRLMITSILQSLMKTIDDSEVPVLLMFNEFAALGHLPIVEKSMAMMRGYGIKLWAVYQDLPQAKDVYRDRWESFIANAGVVQAFAPQDMTTAEFLSKRSGQRTEDILGYSASIDDGGRHQNGSTSFAIQGLPRMLPETIINMDVGYSIMFSHKTKGVVYSWLPDPSELPAYYDATAGAPA